MLFFVETIETYCFVFEIFCFKQEKRSRLERTDIGLSYFVLITFYSFFYYQNIINNNKIEHNWGHTMLLHRLFQSH